MSYITDRYFDFQKRRALSTSDQLVQAGRWDDAVNILTKANYKKADTALESRLVNLRHRAFGELPIAASNAPWPRPVPSPFPGDTILPDIHASEMTAEKVAAGIQHYGSIIVRGLLDKETAETVRQGIDAAFETRVALADNPDQDGAPWYVPFKASGKERFDDWDRAYARDGGGLLAVDSPRTLFLYIEALRKAGFGELLNEYFGERPALSAKKTTLRRTEPDSVAGWHQDGSFLGEQTRSLNIWTAFTPCGVEAPSLDIFAERYEHLVKMGGEGIFDWSVSDETAQSHGVDKVVRPVFEAGDAILFDQLTLHRTGVDPAMDKRRFAIEMWFFAPSTYPMEQIPLYL